MAQYKITKIMVYRVEISDSVPEEAREHFATSEVEAGNAKLELCEYDYFERV